MNASLQSQLSAVRFVLFGRATPKRVRKPRVQANVVPVVPNNMPNVRVNSVTFSFPVLNYDSN